MSQDARTKNQLLRAREGSENVTIIVQFAKKVRVLEKGNTIKHTRDRDKVIYGTVVWRFIHFYTLVSCIANVFERARSKRNKKKEQNFLRWKTLRRYPRTNGERQIIVSKRRGKQSKIGLYRC